MRQSLLNSVLLGLVLFTGSTCKKDAIVDPPPVVTPLPPVLLKDIVIPRLASPFYHFEYDSTARITFVSYASGLYRYDIFFTANRMTEMRNNIPVNKDRIQYHYNQAGQVNLIAYADSSGFIYTTIELSYTGPLLVKWKRAKKSGAAFIMDEQMDLQYYADGNLREIRDHRLPFNGQQELHFTDRFEEYDDKINVEGFSLLHKEFFDHLVLLPGIQLQKNNHRKFMRTGDGVNYTITYTYSFNDKNIPLHKTGIGIWLNGRDSGKLFTSNSSFTYY
jgi:hypothetical protein